MPVRAEAHHHCGPAPTGSESCRGRGPPTNLVHYPGLPLFREDVRRDLPLLYLAMQLVRCHRRSPSAPEPRRRCAPQSTTGSGCVGPPRCDGQKRHHSGGEEENGRCTGSIMGKADGPMSGISRAPGRNAPHGWRHRDEPHLAFLSSVLL